MHQQQDSSALLVCQVLTHLSIGFLCAQILFFFNCLWSYLFTIPHSHSSAFIGVSSAHGPSPQVSDIMEVMRPKARSMSSRSSIYCFGIVKYFLLWHCHIFIVLALSYIYCLATICPTNAIFVTGNLAEWDRPFKLLRGQQDCLLI